MRRSKADPETFQLLMASYQRVVQRVNKRASRNYFADLRHCVRKERTDHRLLTFGGNLSGDITERASPLARSRAGSFSRSGLSE